MHAPWDRHKMEWVITHDGTLNWIDNRQTYLMHKQCLIDALEEFLRWLETQAK